MDDEHGGSTMACQIFQWLLAGEPPALYQAMVGVGCLLTYDLVSRWRKHRRQLQMSESGKTTAEQVQSHPEYDDQRRAA
jgi:hypothetical protein